MSTIHQYTKYVLNQTKSRGTPPFSLDVTTSKTFSEVIASIYTTKLPHAMNLHNLNHISTTNHQQGYEPICILSNHTTILIAPIVPTPNHNSTTHSNHFSGPTSNSKKKPVPYNCTLHKPPTKISKAQTFIFFF